MSDKPTSFRIKQENLAKLNAIAKRKDISLNKAINLIISSYSLLEETPKKNTSVDFDSLKKDLSSQRQRINILQNQIDFLIKRLKDDKPRDHKNSQGQ